MNKELYTGCTMRDGSYTKKRGPYTEKKIPLLKYLKTIFFKES